MKKILFIVPKLDGGGAERFIINLCSSIDSDQFECKLLVLSSDGDFIENAKNLKIDVILGNSVRVRESLIDVISFISKIKPDIVFSTLSHFNLLVGFISILFPKIKFIARETNIVSKENRRGVFFDFLYRLSYSLFDKIIVQSDDMYNDFVTTYHIPQKDVEKINNPIDIKKIEDYRDFSRSIQFDSSKINLITVGRLSYQKGYDLLLHSFAKFSNIERYHLYIIGKGDNLNDLEHLSKELNCDNHVSFLGFINPPYPLIMDADFFISSSRYEGFPNVVLESLSCGTPVISNNYKGGITEIINNSNGRIIDITNSIHFQNSVDGSIRNLKKDDIVSSVNKFDSSVIIEKYMNLFKTV
ncbi:glycosyltransferase [Halosquirtibacter xylanolyticus]|uniref:glycosyltransferase n=1 Tax=Halosquirtibacter xylanolyticus TaxID=3374599 RepID=UPI00374860D6|nr:glycosyltransferase [Prolixibacteraceae bacterium]